MCSKNIVFTLGFWVGLSQNLGFGVSVPSARCLISTITRNHDNRKHTRKGKGRNFGIRPERYTNSNDMRSINSSSWDILKTYPLTVAVESCLAADFSGERSMLRSVLFRALWKWGDSSHAAAVRAVPAVPMTRAHDTYLDRGGASEGVSRERGVCSPLSRFLCRGRGGEGGGRPPQHDMTLTRRGGGSAEAVVDISKRFERFCKRFTNAPFPTAPPASTASTASTASSRQNHTT